MLMYFIERDHISNFLILAMWIWFVLRVILIPSMMIYFLKKERFNLVEREFKIPVFWSMILDFIAFALICIIVKKLLWDIDTVYLVSLTLISFWFIISFNHKKLFWNVLSLLIIENALFLLSIFLSWWITFFVELWILVDVIFWFLVSIIALVKIKSIDEKIDIESISTLKEVF